MAILNLVLTQQIYSEETNGAHAHYREPVPLIHAKSKTQFSSGKRRNIVWKYLHDTELLYFFRS